MYKFSKLGGCGSSIKPATPIFSFLNGKKVLSGKKVLNGKKVGNTTPKSSTNSGPRRNRLNTEPGPWMEECAPKCNTEHAPFIEGRALNCPEYPRNFWYQGTDGRWFNDDVCTEGEDEDEVGRAEPSEEEGNRK